jgi:cobalt transporter subunit CbtA
MFNLAVFKRMLSAVVLAGMLSGLLLAAVQKIQVSQIILKAEEYEDAAAAAATLVAAAPAAHTHSAAQGQSHEHEQDEWQPANGLERTLFTALADVTMAVGFGLLLAVCFCLRAEKGGWRTGLVWGLAGYAVFFAAPALGLHPEVPGTEAAPLADRQLWWAMTAALTASGLSLLVFAKNWPLKVIGAALLIVPHVIGAPQPEIHHSAAPMELAHAFINATAIANAVFWLALGGLMGFFYKKFA